MNKIYINVILAILLSVFLGSCDKYLNVEPKSSLSEDEMFASEAGFQQALSGVYASLASRNLYGDNFTMGFVSALAQNYATSGEGNLFVETRAYNYTSLEVSEYVTGTWSGAYNAIASVNNILKFSESNRSVLSNNSYQQIRGEALAIRALLHFDLLRLFAPAYAVDPSAQAIPYKVSIDQYSVGPSSVSEIIGFVLSDLKEAETLLEGLDPIFANTMQRRFKLNYYAVKGLQARVYLYKGENSEAYTAAKTVIDSEKFPFVDQSAVNTSSAGIKDRLFMSELVFALRNRDLSSWAVDAYFTFYINSTYRLTRPSADIATIYEANTNDLRYGNLFENSSDVLFPSKFWQTSTSTIDSTRLDRMIPVVRMSELRYIMAETAPSLSESLDQLNLVRLGRHLTEFPKDASTLNSTFIQAEITKEYQKECYAEGQLFFFYKRLNFSQIQFAPTTFGTSVYVLPIPENEKEFNNYYQ
ncbi:RagB/SusD family nutrient uptake outer membrane protein [Sphingobacterium alkalisoli]|nr:RagB/SusD family nutrient uptake outer membrane protein [Sphingobacterium alkalisoli]